MLIMYRVNNYMSFKNDAILDLRKTSFREHKSHILEIDNFELLKSVAIYGANASGKSNFISSIAAFQDIINSQFYYEKDNDDKENDISSKFKIRPFLFTDKINDSVEFEIIFLNKSLYQYGISIESEQIISEWLMVDNEMVFERTKQNLEYGEIFGHVLSKYSKFRKDQLYVALLDYFVVEDEIKSILEKFKEFFSSKLNLYFEIIFESSIKGAATGVRFTKKLESDEAFRSKVADYLKKIDVGINDVVVDTEIKKSKRTGVEEEKKVIKTLHNVYDDDGNIISSKLLDLHFESSGTLRFFSFIQEILDIMENGGVFIVDELSSRLHPLLTKFIVDLFQSDNNCKTQLIFTTHDTNLMNKDQFRRDEIVFIDKDERGISKIYTLSDLDVRKDASFEKDYFNGKYGAIPIIKSYTINECGEVDG